MRSTAALKNVLFVLWTGLIRLVRALYGGSETAQNARRKQARFVHRSWNRPQLPTGRASCLGGTCASSPCSLVLDRLSFLASSPCTDKMSFHPPLAESRVRASRSSYLRAACGRSGQLYFAESSSVGALAPNRQPLYAPVTPHLARARLCSAARRSAAQ